MLHFKRPDGPPPDPEEVLVGTCIACKAEVELERWRAEPPKVGTAWKEPGVWLDLPSCECPTAKCKTRVYLRVKR